MNLLTKNKIEKTAAAVVIMAALAVIGLVAYPAKGKESRYRTARITKGDIVSSVSATGTVSPVETVQVGTQVSGTIRSIHAGFNSRVKTGDILARLEPSLFEARLEHTKGGVLVAEANLERSLAGMKDAQRALSRKQDLFNGDHIPRSELETAGTALQIAEAEVSAAKGELTRARGAVIDAETNLGHTIIRSPVDGIVTAKSVEVGQTVAASYQTPTLFSIARDLARMRVECNVDEADIGKVSIGQLVEFTVAAAPDVTFRSKVTQIRQAPVKNENIISYQILLETDNREFILRPGMTANATITTAMKRNVLRIPNAALRFMSSRSGKKKEERVWIPGKEKLKQVDVRTGISDGSYTEMVSGRLNEGMEVVVESTARDGRKSQPAGGALHGVRY
jgi:HlyD family secretion protein